jgi:hypothetical protein
MFLSAKLLGHHLISDFELKGFLSSARMLSRNVVVYFKLVGAKKSMKEILQSLLFLFDIFTDVKFTIWLRNQFIKKTA